MERAGELEPGVLSTFRLFIGVQLIISVLGVIAPWLIPFHAPAEVIRHMNAVLSSTAIFTQLTITAISSSLLFLYLSVSSLRHALKSFYLPVAIIWATVIPILSPYLELHFVGNRLPEFFLQTAFWQQIILLFIPLIVTSWQYSISKIILFFASTTALNIILLFSGIVLIEQALLRTLLGILFIQVIAFLLVGHMIASLVRVQREQRRRLTEANERLAQHASTVEQLTLSQERNRMARELHDVLAHTLSGVAVELEGLRATMQRDPEQSTALLNHSLQAIREGLTETRRALQELRAKPLEDLGLALAVQNLAEVYASRSDFQLELDIDHNLGDHPAEIQQSVYRIAQEALANIADHAQAENVYVQLKQDRGRLMLSIRDDGCGFDPRNSKNEKHYGLLGMRERAEMAGGKLTVESRAGKGTQISFWYGDVQ
ncbi:MAG TPA: sensor histidine kinase [Anaerolineales bacterium]|nr:sensor histidine kinase [Anaerolineales bacterium]